MPSSSKTTKLNLNNWSGSDQPKRADFNADNAIIDDIVGTHNENNAIHCTQAEKNLWNAPFVTGRYIGVGTESRFITLPFYAKFVIVFEEDSPANVVNFSAPKSSSLMAMGTRIGATKGIYIDESGFTVSNGSGTTGSVAELNRSAQTYTYIAFK